MKKFFKNKNHVLIGLGVGSIFGLCLGIGLGGIIGTPSLGVITGVSSGAICGSLMAMFV